MLSRGSAVALRLAAANLGARRATPTRSHALLAAVALAFGLFGWLPASPARADEDYSLELPVLGRTTFSLTSTSIFRYRGNNYDGNQYDDDFGSLYERLEMALQADQLRVETRIDASCRTRPSRRSRAAQPARSGRTIRAATSSGTCGPSA